MSCIELRSGTRPVRVFHWSLVLPFSNRVLYRRRNRLDLHVAARYTVLRLVLFRIFGFFWGFIGGRP